MAWYEIPNTNLMSIYFTIIFGVITVIFVFRLWLKATCGKFESDVRLSLCKRPCGASFNGFNFRQVRMDGKTVLITGANSGIGEFKHFSTSSNPADDLSPIAQERKPPVTWPVEEPASSWLAAQWKPQTKLEVSPSTDFFPTSSSITETNPCT